MGRPKKFEEELVSLSFKVPKSLHNEINSLVDGSFSGVKTPLLLEFMKLGIEEFKRKNPDVVKRAKERTHLKKMAM
jgi:hypothetical protein